MITINYKKIVFFGAHDVCDNNLVLKS